MKFGSIPTSDAEGTILAHGHKSSGLVLKKGTVLSSADCVALRSAGVDSIIVARLESGDIDENEAARRIGASLAPPDSGLTAHSPFTGRVNIYCESSGLFCVSRDLIDSLNRIDSSLTISTLPSDTRVESSRLVATVKIIPFALSASLVTRALDLLVAESTESIMRVHSPISSTVGLISTTLPTLKPSTITKTESILSDRLSIWGSSLGESVRVPHTISSVSSSLSSLCSTSDLLVVFGASAICDISDIIPSAIISSGGVIEYFGMPVDPGNLLLLGRLSGKWVIGAPGCARSPSENGFDWVLSRALCGAPLSSSYMSSLGVGGLLMEISQRGHGREG